MTQNYNPIVRTFGQVRAALVKAVGVPRSAVRPGTELETLLPVDGRRALWNRARQQEPQLPALQLSPEEATWGCLGVLVAAAALAVALRDPAGLLAIIPLGFLVYGASRPWAVHFPLGLQTAGELTLHLTRLGDHRDSGYRPTRNEILIKVRLVLAYALNRPLADVRPESTLQDLGAE